MLRAEASGHSGWGLHPPAVLNRSRTLLSLGLAAGSVKRRHDRRQPLLLGLSGGAF